MHALQGRQFSYKQRKYTMDWGSLNLSSPFWKFTDATMDKNLINYKKGDFHLNLKGPYGKIITCSRDLSRSIKTCQLFKITQVTLPNKWPKIPKNRKIVPLF